MGRASVPCVYATGTQMEWGKAQVLREGSDVTLIACGVEIEEALMAAAALEVQGISAEVIDAFSVKPLDADTLLASVAKTRCVVTAEEHSIMGGLGDAVARLLAEHDPVPCESVAVRDHFGKSGQFDELMSAFGLDSSAIVAAAERALDRRS